MMWGFTDPVARAWLARLHALKARTSSVRNEVDRIVQHTQRLYEGGMRAEALDVATSAKQRCTYLCDEIEEVVAQLESRGVKACGLEDVIAPMEKAQEDLDLLARVLHE